MSRCNAFQPPAEGNLMSRLDIDCGKPGPVSLRRNRHLIKEALVEAVLTH
jgi:hypothetical protein